MVVRAFHPSAQGVDLMSSGRAIPMSRRHDAGLFEATVDTEAGARPTTDLDYRLRFTFHDGQVHEIDDPYRYGRVLTDFDLHLLNEGTHLRAFEKLGARRRTLGIKTGVHFAVWAPNASRVSLVGDFNGWDGRVLPMRRLATSGIWEIFMPDLAEGQRYKFEIRAADGTVRTKTDPYGIFFEAPPNSAAIVWDLARHAWGDGLWMEERRARQSWMDRPMSIYEVHLGSWRRGLANQRLTYRQLADELVPYVKEMGYTHVELLPVMEHPFEGSWGYQVIGFFAPTSRFGPPEDFKAFVDACHQAGIGVILDWVPGHFPKDDYALARFDGTALYEHADPRQGEHRDWGTLVFNYGRREVRNFLLSSALFWLEEYHADGLRVDAVASMLYLDYSRQPGEWVPNKFGGRENLEAIEFLRELNIQTHGQFPGTITVAEESTSWPAVSRPAYVGGLGFTYKWNMGWMHDILEYMKQDPLFRRWAHNHLTFSMLYAYSENFILPFSHDEVVHGKGSMLNKMFGDAWQKASSLRALYGFMFGHPGKKLMFMGQEFGQWREWNHDAGLDWRLLEHPVHRGIRQFTKDVNALYAAEPALHQLDEQPGGFAWIDCSDNEHSVVSFIRRAKAPDDFVVMAFNFTPVPRSAYRIGVPGPGRYVELLNSDAAVYGGSNLGNGGEVIADAIEKHGHMQSVSLTLPPLSCILLKPVRDSR
jgi:1,4-alpha-glucan branching enzyme